MTEQEDILEYMIRIGGRSCRKWKGKLGKVDGVGASALLSLRQLSLVEVSLLLNRCGTTSSLAGYLSCTDVYNF